MEMKKYPDIENHYRQKEIDRWLERYPELANERFVLEEKIDGANFQIIVNGQTKEKTYASRNMILGETTNFFDYQNVIKSHMDRIDEFISWWGKFDELRIFGELFGKGIQNCIDYGDEKYYRIFDVYIDKVWVAPEDIEAANTSLGLNIIIPIISNFVTSLQEALDFDIEINSPFNPKENNLMEGIVIKPYDKIYLDHNNQPFFLKKKNPEFNEQAKKKNKVPIIVDKDIESMQQLFVQYLNENRVLSAFSKIGEIDNPKDIGKYIIMITEDAKKDFLQDYNDDFIALDIKQQKKVYSIAGKIIVPILNRYL